MLAIDARYPFAKEIHRLLKPYSTLVLLFILVGTAVAATEPPTTVSGQGKPGATESSLPLINGEVKKVDKERGRLTIKHDAITNLGMPAMTMVFRVKAPAMLDQVNSGDAIRFSVDKVNGALTVMRLEPLAATGGNAQLK